MSYKIIEKIDKWTGKFPHDLRILVCAVIFFITMSRTSFDQNIAEWLLVVFTGGLWFSTFQLWKASERQALDTQRTIALMQKQLESEFRPYLTLELQALSMSKDKTKIAGAITLKNLGRGIAKNIAVKYLFLITDSVPNEFKNENVGSCQNILPGNSLSFEAKNHALSVSMIDEMGGKYSGKHVYFRCMAEYYDQFDHLYHTEYCVYVSIDGMVMLLQYPEQDIDVQKFKILRYSEQYNEAT